MISSKISKSFSISLLLLMLTYATHAQYASVAGTYSGVIPCADCEGIKYRLVLNADGNYAEIMVYKGKNTAPFTSSGKYTLKKNSVTLIQSTPGMTYFMKVPDGLQILDASGNAITGATANMYLLKDESQTANTNQNAATNISALNKKKHEAGIGFYANGNEPWWSLDIDFNKGMYFKTADGKVINTPAVKGVKAMDANVTMYSAQSFDGSLQVQIMQQPCTNKITGDVAQYSVSIEAKTANTDKATTYDGCGLYTPDYVLNGSWTLLTIGAGENVDPKKYKQGVPNLFIDIDAKSISGFGGCNRFSGKLHQEQNRIRFLNVASTLMACNDDGSEAAFLKALQVSINYKIVGGKLILSNPEGVKLTFEKIKEQANTVTGKNEIAGLNDIWVLETFNGIKPDKKYYSKGLPQLEFHIVDMKYIGNTGCNNISGKFDATAKSIKIYDGPMTRMYCEGVNENEFLKALHGATDYKIENMHLTLMQNKKPTLVFKKVD